MKRIYFLFIGIFLLQNIHAQVRSIINFNNNWKFYLGNDSTASNENFNDDNWRTLNLPHDWSIEGNFAKENPATTQGGALPGGIGWYRKTFSIPTSAKNKNIAIEFDGVYKNSEVWINGNYLGKRPNGYISFQYDLTAYLKFGKAKNIIAVKVDNSKQPNSRWYSGSGIYRDVRLTIFAQNYFLKDRFFVTTPKIDKDTATILIDARFITVYKNYEKSKVKTTIFSDQGKIIFSYISEVGSGNNMTGILYDFKIPNPVFWEIDNPYLYTLKLELLSWSNIKLDDITSTFGIRSIKFDREKGFFLNNKPLKIKGVCMHHDLGALGAAYNNSAAERQLRILKEMGCNSIRTSHNAPAPAFLDLCDKMGFLVMDEAFDIWQKKKNKFDYSLDFAAWHKKDLEDLILRDRNHPSVFMWSIGNEIREQFDSTGIALTKELVDIVKRFDNTRPITAALTEIDTLKNFMYQANTLDVLGWNYNDKNYADVLKKYPNQIFIASETNSAIATRGHYDMPSDSVRVWPAKGKKEIENVNGDWTVSAYDNAMTYWGSTHEETWKIIKKYDFLSGMFVWTGFDYLGEPTPYPWPARSSYFGIIDLAGFPKDAYYMYQSEWTTKPVLHIFPHWTPEKIGTGWPHGKIVDVWAYYNNADEVELFLNSKSLGVKKKINDDLHVMWRVPFEPGTLKAISKKDGKIVLQKEIKTAGEPYKIELIADEMSKYGDSNGLGFITARVVDKDGNLVPNANNLIEFSISDNAKIVATDNGYQADTTSFFNTKRKAWKGMALAIIKNTSKNRNSTLMAKSVGLLSGTIAWKMPY
jgi:beta-galactosidase